MTGPTPDELLEVCVAAAGAAGEVLVDGVDGPKRVEMKGARSSIVTEIDLAAQRRIFDVIGDSYPAHAIMGEEGDGGGDDRSHLWIVDPLDGTSNYASGIPLACASVAVTDARGVVAGAIFEPFRQELFTATRGGGAWLGAHRLAVRDEPDLTQALICTGLQTDDRAAIAAHARRIEALHAESRGARQLGSPAVCHAYVAAGRIDAFFERDGTYAWDVAAGSLMVAEAGGRCEALDGGPVHLGPGFSDVIATNGTVHDDLLDLIRRAERSI